MIIPHVVYHVAEMGDWKEVVAEQFRLLRDSGLGLTEAIRVTFVGVDLVWLREEAIRVGIQIEVVYFDANLMHCETFAMLEIERLAKVEKTDRPILYFHTKGVSAPGHRGKYVWRRSMEEYVVRLWQHNLQFISDESGYDAVGLNWCSVGLQHFSGNFWIARADWIRRLPDFVGYHHARNLVRFSCETWIGALQWCRAYSLGCSDYWGWDNANKLIGLNPPPPTTPDAIRLNLGCWTFYANGWTNIDLNPDIKADIYGDASTLEGFEENSVNEIYAGHLAEHLVDLEVTFKRWFQVLKPGGVLTVVVPDCEGAVSLWRSNSRFPGIDVDADSGLVGTATGYRTREEAAADVHGFQVHKRMFDQSLLSLCLKACGFVELRGVDNHPLMVVSCSRLGWQIAIEVKKPQTSMILPTFSPSSCVT